MDEDNRSDRVLQQVDTAIVSLGSDGYLFSVPFPLPCMFFCLFVWLSVCLSVCLIRLVDLCYHLTGQFSVRPAGFFLTVRNCLTTKLNPMKMANMNMQITTTTPTPTLPISLPLSLSLLFCIMYNLIFFFYDSLHSSSDIFFHPIVPVLSHCSFVLNSIVIVLL